MTIVMDLRFSIGTRPVRAELTTSAVRIAIVGASGVGKTTLLRAIAGTLPDVRGSLSVRGEVFLDGGEARIPTERRQLGWAPQESLLFPHLSVRENVAFSAATPSRATDLAKTLGLDGLLDRRPGSLSGGERQRVAIARALAARPRLLLLDEPLSALDRPRRSELALVIETERAALDAILLLVSHDETDVAALADEVYVLDETGTLTPR